MEPGFSLRSRLIVSAAILCLSIAFIGGNAGAESAGDCKKGLLACARETPVSSLHFGLWTFGNELRSALLEGNVFKPTTRIRSKIGSTEYAEILGIVVIDSGLKCDELARFLTNYIGHWNRMATIFPSEEDIRNWMSTEADARTNRDACFKVATYAVPSDLNHVSDKDLFELCTAIRIQIVPVENPETKAFSKPCVAPLNNWQP